MTISTKSGFECDFDVAALDDWELHELVLDGDGKQLSDSRFVRAVIDKCIGKEDAEVKS